MSRKPKLTKEQKRRGWLKFMLFMAGLSILLFCLGFIVFAHRVETLSPPSALEKADGIVVWTGRGGGRLTTGGQLLTDNKGERLLISGVNEQNSLEDITQLTGLSQSHAQCCLDLDYLAKDTIGNARETASWAQALSYEHIILVTSAFHMPRAQLEISAVAGRMRITPYPVTNPGQARWYKNAARFKRLGQEYVKLLLAYLRDPASREDQGAPLLPPLPAEAQK